VTDNFDHVVDVLVVGSGAGGMSSAWSSAARGLDTLVIEKAAVYGGSTSLSGGGSWIPNAPQLVAEGERDDPELLLKDMRTIAPDVTPERQRRYLQEAPRLQQALAKTKAFHKGFFWVKGYSDYHPDKGGNPKGRGVWASPIDLRLLGEDAASLRGGHARLPGAPDGLWVTTSDVRDLLALRWGTWRGRFVMFRLAWRILVTRIRGAKMQASGAALITRWRLALKELGVPLWCETPMRSLITDESGRVTGVLAERNGKTIRIGARSGVVLAAGGFEHNAEMREQYQPEVAGKGWSSGSPDNVGDGIRAGQDIGAAVDLMDDAWWMPSMQLPDSVRPTVFERSFPNQFIVNGDGRRFTNEAAPYTDFVHDLLAGHRAGVNHIPVYMIMDHYAWTHNLIVGHLPGTAMPPEWLESGLVSRADTLEELAEKIGLPPQNLVATAERFNGFARQARDDDFHRGESAYDNFYGNAKYPNPNLAEVNKPPYYAFTFLPGDLGTKGGLLTDENARVLNGDGSPITGLFSVGNNSASVMGNSYAGPGATIGPAMTFGWIAANYLADQKAGNSDST